MEGLKIIIIEKCYLEVSYYSTGEKEK